MDAPAPGRKEGAVVRSLGDVGLRRPLEKKIIRPTTIATGIEPKIQSRTPRSDQASQSAKCTRPILTAAPSSRPRLPQCSLTVSADLRLNRLEPKDPSNEGRARAPRAHPNVLPIPTERAATTPAIYRTVRVLMRVRVTDPAALPDLMTFLMSRTDATVEQIADGMLEVTLLGSHDLDAMRMQLYLRIRTWEAIRHGTGTKVEIDA